MMRVAFLGLKGEFDPEQNGISHRYTRELYSSVSKAKFKNKDVQIDAVEIPLNPILGAGLSFFANTLIKNFEGYDIIHNINFKPCIPILKRKAVFLTTALDFQPLLYPDLKRKFSVNLKTWLWMRLVVEFGLKMALKSDYMITISTQTKEEAIILGYDKNKIFVVNIGISPKFIRTPIKSNKNKKFLVGYIGSFAPHKNTIMSIAAFKKIPDKDMRFEIWGHSKYWYETLKKSASDDKRIVFKGFAPEKDIVSIYDSFDVYIHPVLHCGFEMEILEAQARGLPVVIYKKGKVPKEVRKYCLEAEDVDQMAKILIDLKENGYSEKLRKEAMLYARSFTWEKCANETINVYRKIINH